MADNVCALVGVGPGLGLSLARRFGREGYRVALMARRAAALESYPERLAKEGVEAHAFGADAGDPDSLSRAFERVRAELGHPGVLIYNAGILREALPTELSAEQLAEDLRVNVLGALMSAQHVLPHMREQGRGTVLFTGGGFGLEPMPKYTSLGIGKAAIRNLTKSLAKEVEPDGVHVGTITICGIIQRGTHFDPNRIADSFWELHAQPRGSWDHELRFE